MEFPGDRMVKVLHFHCPGPKFNLWSGNYNPTPCQNNSSNNKIKPTNKKPTQNKTTKNSCFRWKPRLNEKLIPDLRDRNKWRERERDKEGGGESKRREKPFFFFYKLGCGNRISERHSRFPVLGGGWRYAGCQRGGPLTLPLAVQ